jgi:hypothetical protein
MRKNRILLLLLLLIFMATAVQTREVFFLIPGQAYNVSFNVSGIDNAPYQTTEKAVVHGQTVYEQIGFMMGLSNSTSLDATLNETYGNTTVVSAAEIVRNKFAKFNSTDYQTKSITLDNWQWFVGYGNIRDENKSGTLIVAATQISDKAMCTLRTYNNSSAFDYTLTSLKISSRI